jgi:hypothetical protein
MKFGQSPLDALRKCEYFITPLAFIKKVVETTGGLFIRPFGGEDRQLSTNVVSRRSKDVAIMYT